MNAYERLHKDYTAQALANTRQQPKVATNTMQSPVTTQPHATNRSQTLLSLVKNYEKNRQSLVLIKRELESGADPNVVDEEGRPLIFHCLRDNGMNRSLLPLLFEHYADPNACDIIGRPALIHCILGDMRTSVSSLLNCGADANAVDCDGSRALNLAIDRNSFYLVMRLVEFGADVNLADTRGLTPLLHAAMAPFLCRDANVGDVIARMCDARPTVKPSHRMRADISAKERAVIAGARKICRMIMSVLIRNGADIRSSNRNRETALHHAVRNGDNCTILYLLDQNHSAVLDSDNQGRNVLHWACLRGYGDVAGEILDRVTDVEKKCLIPQQDEYHCSPIILASGSGLVGVVQYLVPFSTNVQLLRAQERVATSTTACRQCRIKIHHILFTALLERCHGWHVGRPTV